MNRLKQALCEFKTQVCISVLVNISVCMFLFLDKIENSAKTSAEALQYEIK